jgi:hypothetical protein
MSGSEDKTKLICPLWTFSFAGQVPGENPRKKKRSPLPAALFS